MYLPKIFKNNLRMKVPPFLEVHVMLYLLKQSVSLF